MIPVPIVLPFGPVVVPGFTPPVTVVSGAE